MKKHFTVTEWDGSARRGLLTLGKGEVETPAFMPVGTLGAIKGIDHQEVHDLGFRLMLANTYHLYLSPGSKGIQSAGGLHSFTSWEGNFLTDSGGFQVFSLSALRKITAKGVEFRSHRDGSKHLFTPESVVEFQALLGSDIQMALDVCTPYGVSHEEASTALDYTTEWMKRAVARRNELSEYNGFLFPIIQGNFYADLRKKSAEETFETHPPGVAVGGLSVGEPRGVYEEHLYSTLELIPDELPRYVMGIGTPDYILAAVEAGVDLFDCVYPTRVGRNAAFMTSNGLLSIKQERYKHDNAPVDSECGCQVCQRYSRAFLRHLFKNNDLLAPVLATRHNLWYMARFIAEIRMAISEKRYASFKEEYLERCYPERQASG